TLTPRAAERRTAAEPSLLAYRDKLPFILQTLVSTLDLRVALGIIVDTVLELTGMTRGSILLTEHGTLRSVVERAMTPLRPGTRSASMVEAVARDGQALVYPDVSRAPSVPMAS